MKHFLGLYFYALLAIVSGADIKKAARSNEEEGGVFLMVALFFALAAWGLS